jgi:hypothetical protein
VFFFALLLQFFFFYRNIGFGQLNFGFRWRSFLRYRLGFRLGALLRLYPWLRQRRQAAPQLYRYGLRRMALPAHRKHEQGKKCRMHQER